ncbi:MAG: FecR domain-containing protein [Planctomycetes bacterium]|nr:FecR domain-containing protein [Planctomycetota bacterium]
MMELKDEDRDLMLSMYLDGELEPEQAKAVEHRIRTDAAWQDEYQALTYTESRISKAVEANWHDEVLTEKIMVQVGKLPKPSTATVQAASQRLQTSKRQAEADELARAARERRVRRFGWGAAALLLFAVTLKLLLGGGAATNVAKDTPPTRATFDSASAKVLDPGAEAGAGKLAEGQTLAASADGAAVAWSDGSRLWLRRDARVRAAGPRRLDLLGGTLLIEAARDEAHAFEITLPNGSLAQALGTRFEVAVAENGATVRVLEGRVRLSEPGGRQADALGGQAIDTDFKVAAFDPRELNLGWREAAGRDSKGAQRAFAAPWPQLGGGPGHTGWTPFNGPAGLAARDFIPFAEGNGEAPEQRTPAVVGAGNVAYVLRGEKGTTRLYAIDLDAAAPHPAPCGEALPGTSQNPPVITPKGLVVAGTTGNKIMAWDPAKNAAAWTVEAKHSVYALAAAYDGTIYASTHGELLALDEAGRVRWRHAVAADLQAPACVLASGEVVAVSRDGKVDRLTSSGELLDTRMWTGKGDVFWPPVEYVRGGTVSFSTPESLSLLVLKTGEEHSRNFPSTWPLGTGTCTSGSKVLFSTSGSASLFIDGDIVALAQDSEGRVYAGAKDTLFRVAQSEMQSTQPVFAAAKKGEIVRGGIAILPGRVVVTTTAGLQIFE